MNEMFPDALIARSRYEPLMKSMTNQEKDRHVMAAAVVAEIDVLVTNNVADFPKESIDPYNIEVQTADQFVRQQAALNPAAFLDRFLSRARERNKLSLARGDGPVTPQDLALFLRDGPSEMVATGQFIMDLLRNLFTGDK
jgi:hypothetical protein